MAASFRTVSLVAVTLFSFGGAPVGAQTIEQALRLAYRNNPDLNAARAGVRVANEGIPAALSGYRPSVNATVQQALTATGNRAPRVPTTTNPSTISSIDTTIRPRSVTITATQPIFDGNRTTNTVRQADQNVMVARETLRNTEQTVLLASATAYMNVLREQAVLDLQRRNVQVLTEQLRATRDRFAVGEVTRTDVALAESRLQGAIASASQAESNLANSRAVFMQQIGVQPPARLAAARTMERLLPRAMDDAIASGLARHPSIRGARHGADAALLQVRIAESALYPTLNLQASYTRGAEQSTISNQNYSASVAAVLTIPIFATGGSAFATIRQAKETAGQRRIQVDTAIASVRQAVVQSWAGLMAARAQIQAAEAQVRAAEIALNGVREEARVGQRTTLDVLNATQDLTNARVQLVQFQRDRVVLSYSVLAAMGRLDAAAIGLGVEIYDPTVHYDQVRDLWWGVRTPDGR